LLVDLWQRGDQPAKLDTSVEQEDQAKRALLEAERQRLQRLPASSRYAVHRLRVVSRALDLLNVAATVGVLGQLSFSDKRRAFSPPSFLSLPRSPSLTLSLSPSLSLRLV